MAAPAPAPAPPAPAPAPEPTRLGLNQDIATLGCGPGGSRRGCVFTSDQRVYSRVFNLRAGKVQNTRIHLAILVYSTCRPTCFWRVSSYARGATFQVYGSASLRVADLSSCK